MAEKPGSKAFVSPLRDVEGDKCFWANNGAVIKNLYELYNSLETMDEATFSHHVNELRNDFYNWVNDVIKDRKLADKLAGIKTKAEAAKSVKERISELTVRQKKESPKKEKKKSVKRTAKKHAEKITKKTIKKKESKAETPAKKKSDRAFTISGTLIALVTLFAVVGIINSSRSAITGAAAAEVSRGVTPFIGILIIVAASLAVVITREIKNRQK